MRTVLPLLVVLVGCSYPPLDDTDGIYGTDGTDAGTQASNCLAPASYGSPTETNQVAVFHETTSTTNAEAIVQMGQITNGSPADYLAIGLFANTSQIPGPRVVAPATFTLAPSSTACGACVVLYVKCSNCYSDSPTVAATYMATQGTLQIDSILTNIVGKLTNAKLVHVNIANDGKPTIASGCTTQISSASFNVLIQ